MLFNVDLNIFVNEVYLFRISSLKYHSITKYNQVFFILSYVVDVQRALMMND